MLFSVPTAAILLDTALPYLLSQAVGKLAESRFDEVAPYLWFAAAVGIVGVFFNLLGFQVAVRHEASVRKDLINTTFQDVITKDFDFFSNQKVGALTSKFIDFINAHISLQDLFILRTLTFGISTIFGISIIFVNAPMLGLIVVGLVAFILIQIKISMKIRAPYRHARKKLHAEVNGAVADAISNNATVKTFANEKVERENVSVYAEKYRLAHIKDLRFLSFEGSLRLLITSITQIVAVSIMSYLIQHEEIEIGIAIFVIAYLQRFAGQLFSLGEIINGYDRLFLQAAPMTEILLSDNHIVDSPQAKNLSVRKGDVVFDKVSYAYSDAKGQNVIENLSLTIRAGQKIGLVGHSGAGKTTITRLLLRFDMVTGGHIEVDGQDINSVTQESLRHSIAYVPQEPLLFHRTLRENISYGKPDATDAKIKEAAMRANALEFIEQLPEKLETTVGERGVKLSGGQRQRIAIARAILKDAPILVLDEATSALDSESEKLIQDSLSELMKNRTSIVIAHRLSTVAKLDRIVVIDKGKIVEDDSHSELLKKNGTYAKLWNHQSGGFIEE